LTSWQTGKLGIDYRVMVITDDYTARYNNNVIYVYATRVSKGAGDLTPLPIPSLNIFCVFH